MVLVMIIAFIVSLATHSWIEGGVIAGTSAMLSSSVQVQVPTFAV